MNKPNPFNVLIHIQTWRSRNNYSVPFSIAIVANPVTGEELTIGNAKNLCQLFYRLFCRNHFTPRIWRTEELISWSEYRRQEKTVMHESSPELIPILEKMFANLKEI